MKPALFMLWILPPPSSSPYIFTGKNSPRAWCTTYTGKALLMKRADWNTMGLNIVLHFILTPIDERIILYHLIVFIPFHHFHLLTIERLVGSDSRDPYLRILQRPIQGFYFSNMTARFPVLYGIIKGIYSFLQDHRFNLLVIREEDLDAEVVFLHCQVQQIVCLLKQPARV